MRKLFLILGIGFISAVWFQPTTAKDKTNWEDLLAGDFKDWSRSGSGKSPWRLTTDNSLINDGEADSYTLERIMSDGTLQLEWRFEPNTKKTNGHKACVGVRGDAEGGGCRVALGEGCGSITSSYFSGIDRLKEITIAAPKNHAKKIGDWNTLEIRQAGRSITVFVNGQEASSYESRTTKGLLSLQVQEYPITFRKVWWKAAE